MIPRREFFGLGGAGVAGVAAGFGARSALVPSALGYDAVEERADAAPAPINRLGQQRIVWSFSTDRRVVALTFDDGPDPSFTPAVLDALSAADAQATFFMMGHNARHHSELCRRVIGAGHEIGCHTAEHLDLAVEDSHATVDQVDRGFAELRDVGASSVRWFRPPRGNVTGSTLAAASALGLDIALWSVDGRVRGVETADALTARLSMSIEAGDIVLLHDGIGRGTFYPDEAFAARIRSRREREIEALPGLLSTLRRSGFEFSTLSALVGSTATTT